MAGRRFRSSGGSYRREGRRPGLEAALQHIEEAKQLSAELGGTDADVKTYLFELDSKELNSVLDAYERAYGRKPREYAEETIPRWRSGRVKMSGLVAGRLFSLLPQYMPIQSKFALVKSLWESQCPHSETAFYIGPDAGREDVCGRVRDHLSMVVQDYKIPESITKRFHWLAKDDVELQQQLYNYFLQLNRQVVTDAADDRVPKMLDVIANDGKSHAQVTQTIAIGNHRLVLVFHPNASGVTTQKPPEPKLSVPAAKRGSGCLVMMGIGIGIFITLLQIL